MKKKKKKSIAKLLTYRLLIFTIIINIVAMIIISNTVSGIVRELETEHLNEIVNNIENNVISTIDNYVQLSKVLSKNTSIIELMNESNQQNPMHLNKNKDAVVQELQSISQNFEGVVINFGLLDVEQDGFLTHTGEHSGDDFSFKERHYYSVVEDKQTLVTSPYLDHVTGLMVLAVATPVFDFFGNVQGAILVDLSIEFLNDLIISTEYKETGSSLILDNDDMILAYRDISLIGQPVSALNFEKNSDKLQLEFDNPTQQLLQYSLNNTDKIGIIGNIEKYDWKVLTFMEYTEFSSYTYRILSVFIIVQVITIIITLVIASLTVNISLMPITYIRKAMKELAAGNNEYDLQYTSNNEIGDLADDVRFASKNVTNYVNKIKHQLDYDELTNLYTERKFIKETKRTFDENPNNNYFIVAIDIDNFKYINDTYGYNTGSEFLKAIGEYYYELIGDGAIISRVNGDNYLFLLTENQGLLQSDNTDHFTEICKKAKSIIDVSYDLSISCGVYVVDDKNISISSMIDCASYAKNKCKSTVGISTEYYDKNMSSERNANNYVVSKMRDGVKNKEFLVYYQPKVDLNTNKIAGAEALVRWNNNGKLVPPNDFIPVFETNGFIETLDYYIIDSTCEFIKQNSTKEMPLISVNVSGVTIMKKDVVSKILSIIEKYDLKTSQIELEITESAFVNNFDVATEKINQFRELGFAISMDDFGCGESSLGRLKDIPIDVIKIDREFIVDSFKNDKVDLILRSIIELAKALNLKTVVEGIETNEQRTLITDLGCDLGQGYIFSRPVPADEFLGML